MRRGLAGALATGALLIGAAPAAAQDCGPFTPPSR